MSVVDGLREKAEEKTGRSTVTIPRVTFRSLLDVVEAAEDLHHALAFQEHDPKGVSEASGRVGEALARLQVQLTPAQGAEQRPETGAGA